MNKDELTNETNSEEQNYKIESFGTPKLGDTEESKKYINEMHNFADKNEFMNKVLGIGIGVAVISIIIFSIIMNTISMKTTSVKPSPDVAANKIVINPTVDSPPAKIEPVKTQQTIYEYLNIEANRTDVLKKAVALNKGSTKSITVYLLSETLRTKALAIPTDTSNIEQLMKVLISLDWKKNTDLAQLEKGDICFTTDLPEKPGVPGHAYVFMGWVTEGKTDYGYICDGQVDQYGGNILHNRNISISVGDKDKFSFFLRK